MSFLTCIVISIIVYIYFPKFLSSSILGKYLRTKKSYRCLAMIFSICAQFFVFISICLSIVFYFGDCFIELLEIRQPRMNFTNATCSQLTSYVNIEMNKFLSCTANTSNETNNFNTYFDSKEIELVMQESGLKIVGALGRIKINESDAVDVFMHGSASSKYTKTPCSAITIESMVEVIAQISYYLLSKNNKIKAQIKEAGEREYQDLPLWKIVNDDTADGGYLIEGLDPEKGYLAEIIIPMSVFAFNSTKVSNIVRKHGRLTDLQQAATFSPMMRFSNEFVSASPMLVALTAVFAMLISVYGGYISEKIRFAYFCRHHCNRRVFALILVPLLGGLFTLVAYRHYFLIEYDKLTLLEIFNTSNENILAVIKEMFLFSSLVAYAYLFIKRTLLTIYADAYDDQIWHPICIELDEHATRTPPPTRVNYLSLINLNNRR